MVANLRVEFGAVGLGNIGRVADDGIETRGLLVYWEPREEVRLEETNAAGDVMSDAVSFGNDEGFRRDVNGGDFRMRQMNCESNGDGSGSGANIQDL